VPVAPGDTAATLAARILAQEHRIYPRAIQFFAEGRVGAPQGRRLRVRGATWADRALVNPPLTDGAPRRRARAARGSAGSGRKR
jgi:phosphoribosylglycinamide formyltransferase-1